jgi:hypothetical protein
MSLEKKTICKYKFGLIRSVGERPINLLAYEMHTFALVGHICAIAIWLKNIQKKILLPHTTVHRSAAYLHFPLLCFSPTTET